jgi:hypothetical protein
LRGKAVDNKMRRPRLLSFICCSPDANQYSRSSRHIRAAGFVGHRDRRGRCDSRRRTETAKPDSSRLQVLGSSRWAPGVGHKGAGVLLCKGTLALEARGSRGRGLHRHDLRHDARRRNAPRLSCKRGPLRGGPPNRRPIRGSARERSRTGPPGAASHVHGLPPAGTSLKQRDKGVRDPGEKGLQRRHWPRTLARSDRSGAMGSSGFVPPARCSLLRSSRSRGAPDRGLSRRKARRVARVSCLERGAGLARVSRCDRRRGSLGFTRSKGAARESDAKRSEASPRLRARPRDDDPQLVPTHHSCCTRRRDASGAQEARTPHRSGRKPARPNGCP